MKFWLVLLAVSAAATFRVTPARAATPKEIDAAIEHGVAYLYSQQQNGNWEKVQQPQLSAPPNLVVNDAYIEGNWGGLTGVAVNALLSAGESQHSPKLKAAIDLLLNSPLRANIYSLCERDQVISQLASTPAIRQVLKKDGDYLLRVLETKGEGNGLYGYHRSKPETPTYDHSVSQYGVLAMWTCVENGIEVPLTYWPLVEKSWIGHQDASGGWSYRTKAAGTNNGTITATMTAAGVATLFITQDYVHSDEGLIPRGNITNPAIDKGMAWLAENFDATMKPGLTGAETETYALYGVERCGVASGFKYFGKHNWYQEGADWLVKKQNADGSWGKDSDIFKFNYQNVPATSLAMLFLTRGREPVVMNKLDYKTVVKGKVEEGHWNQRPRDVANITRWIGKQSEHSFNWQIVSLADHSVADFHDSPILYISGDQELVFTPEQEGKLRQYVQEGGLIMGNPDGPSSTLFVKSFQKLAGRLFPMYEMRNLPANHPIFTSEQYRDADLRRRPPIMGLSNGVRELMICPTADFARAWQSRGYASDEAFRIPADIFLYATGEKNLRRKGETHIVRMQPGVQATRKLSLARLDYPGNADPEPAGWTRLAAIVHNEDQVDLTINTIALGDNKLAGYPLAHMTGTTAFTLTESQRAELLHYVQNGGTLLIDAAGGSTAFADAAEQELKLIFPNDASQLAALISADDPLFKVAGLNFEMRTWVTRMKVGKNGAQLRGIRQGDRYGVIFSREDLSNGLVGQPCDGVLGYTPDSATAIVRQIVKTLAK